MKTILHQILNLIYPQTCGICEKISQEPICKKCQTKLDDLFIGKLNNYSDKYFTRHMYIFEYKGIIREKIIQYKFSDKAYLSDMFANFIIKNKKIYGFLKNYDIIIPVPISKNRKKQRGYNQTELIAKKIANNIENISLENKVLKKVKDIVPQSTLTQAERIENVKNAYTIINKEKIQGKSIVLLDDVFTTGSTLNECSRILEKANAKNIDILTIAKD